MRTNSGRRVIILSTLATLWLIFVILFNLDMVRRSIDNLGDFGSFIASGLFLKNGTNPYDASSPLIFEVFLPRVDAGGKMPNLNPPFSLLAFEWIANGDHLFNLNIWRVCSLLLYTAAFLFLANEYKPSFLRTVWAFSLAGLWHTIGLGQIYTLLLLLTVLAWLSDRHNKPFQAGLFLGLLVSIKPNFILWILLLAIQKKWKTVFTSSITVGFCALLPLLRMPLEVYSQWLEATRVDSRVLSMPGNSSLFGLTSRIGMPQLGAFLGVLLLVLTVWALFRNRDAQAEPDLINAIGIFLSLLLSPISWAGYTILALPYFLSRKGWDVPTLVAAAILTVPFTLTLHFYYYYGRLGFLFWGWWFGIALAICFVLILLKLWPVRDQTRWLERPQG